MKTSRRNFIRSGVAGMAGAALFPACQGQAGEPARSNSGLPLMTGEVKALEAGAFEERRRRAMRMMNEQGIDGLLLTGSVNLQYFTNVSWGRSERFFGVLLPAAGEPVWICPAFEKERALERIPDGQEIMVWEEDESPYALVKKALEKTGAPHRQLAVGPTVRYFVVTGLTKELAGTGISLVDGAAITQQCRVIKSPEEIGYLDLANRIQKMAYRHAFSRLEEGMSPGDLAGIIAAALTEMGVSGGGWPQFGKNSAFPHGSQEIHNLEAGDIILVDGGCSVEGYRADVTRTVVFGKPTDRQKQVFDVVLRAQEAVQEAVRPGLACEDLDRIARKVIEDAGFGPGYRYFAHRLGHGIGLEGHEYTYLVEGNKTPLEAGMTFSNEPGIYIYGEFGVRIEDCFVVTEEGSRILGGMTCQSIGEPFGGKA